MSLELKDSVVVYLDILGFSELIKNKNYAEHLLTWIKNTRENNTDKFSVQHITRKDGEEIRVRPAITSFSDSIVLSVPLEEFPQSFGLGGAVTSLLQLVQQLTDSLMCEGYILRGGMTRGGLYHEDGVVFGEALIKAHELESKKAKMPRIIVDTDLAREYNRERYGNNNFLSKDDINIQEDEYYLDYLKLSFQNSAKRKEYQKNTKNTINEYKKNIAERLNMENLNCLNEAIRILEKWICFEKYINRAITEFRFV